MKVYTILVPQYRMFMKMRRVGFLILLLIPMIGVSQIKSTYSFRFGAQVAFSLSKITNNSVGIGGLAGAEYRFSKNFAAEGEASYLYFTGDKVAYEAAKNRAFALPLLVGIKGYLTPEAYVSLRGGVNWFVMNDMPASVFRPAYGIAGGLNLPRSFNRVNVQVGWTGFGYQGTQRGYASLAASIIIN
jgi:hypothetical protein